jgi:hypothetical protein
MASKPEPIILTGLKGNHPLSALAAFGLLRCCAEIAELQNPRLRWELKNDWIAVLSTDNQILNDDLIGFLMGRMKGSSERLEFKWSDKIGTDPDRFMQAAKRSIEIATSCSRSTTDFFAAFGSELIKNRSGKIRPTALDMTSANQGLPNNLRKLAVTLELKQPSQATQQTTNSNAAIKKHAKETAEITASFREALFGPWEYKDEEHSLGWDPTIERLYALRAKNPSPDKKNMSVRAAVWLAAEALPLFPCAVVGNKLATRGFTEKRASGKGERSSIYFSWPLWDSPLSLETLRSLLALKTLTLDQPPTDELRMRGIVQVFRSYRVKTGGESGDYKIFRAAQPCIAGKVNANS